MHFSLNLTRICALNDLTLPGLYRRLLAMTTAISTLIVLCTYVPDLIKNIVIIFATLSFFSAPRFFWTSPCYSKDDSHLSAIRANYLLMAHCRKFMSQRYAASTNSPKFCFFWIPEEIKSTSDIAARIEASGCLDSRGISEDSMRNIWRTLRSSALQKRPHLEKWWKKFRNSCSSA